MTKFYFITLFVALLVSSRYAKAQNAHGDGVDNVLERLEQQILSDEADGFSFPGMRDDQPADDLSGGSGTKAHQATGSKFREPDFANIQQQISNLEKDIDRLASDVQQYKQSAIATSKDNSYVYLEASVIDQKESTLKSIKVKVDGFTVYHIKNTAGLWLHQSAIPLYSGPLSAGTHRIEVEANLGRIYSPGLPVTGPSFKSVEKAFEIQVPLASSNKKYVMSFSAASDPKAEPTVSIKDTL